MQHGLDGLRPELERRHVAHEKIEPLDAIGVACRRHQGLGLFDRGRRVGLVTWAFLQVLDRRGELGEGIDEAADHHRCHILHDVDEHGPLEHEMDGAPHARIVEWLLLAVRPSGLDHALVVVERGHARRALGLARRDRIDDACVVRAARQDCRAKLRREWQAVIELDAVEVGHLLVPIVRVALHYPDFVLDAPLALVWAGAGNIEDAPQVLLVVLERLLAHDDIPAAGKRRHDEVRRPRLSQLELDRMRVAHVDLAHRLEKDRARDGDACRWLGNPVVCGLHVVGGELGAVVKLHVFAQEEGIGLAVLGDLPAVGEIGNDGLAAVAGIATN